MEKLDLLLIESRKAASKAENSRLYRIIRVLEQSPAVSYILDSKHRFVYTNPAWDSFARSNNAPQLAGETIIGFNIFDAIAEVLKPVYTDAFRRLAETGTVWGKTYTCSSPDQARRYRMKIYFMEQRNWFLVTNSLLSKRPHRNSHNAEEGQYFHCGIVTMCAHCRCSQRTDCAKTWDFVPEYLKWTGLNGLKVSYGLCPICQEHFYPHLEPVRIHSE